MTSIQESGGTSDPATHTAARSSGTDSAPSTPLVSSRTPAVRPDDGTAGLPKRICGGSRPSCRSRTITRRPHRDSRHPTSRSSDTTAQTRPFAPRPTATPRCPSATPQHSAVASARTKQKGQVSKPGTSASIHSIELTPGKPAEGVSSVRRQRRSSARVTSFAGQANGPSSRYRPSLRARLTTTARGGTPRITTRPANRSTAASTVCGGPSVRGSTTATRVTSGGTSE